jgi:hypothetical protein
MSQKRSGGSGGLKVCDCKATHTSLLFLFSPALFFGLMSAEESSADVLLLLCVYLPIPYKTRFFGPTYLSGASPSLSGGSGTPSIGAVHTLDIRMQIEQIGKQL